MTFLNVALVSINSYAIKPPQAVAFLSDEVASIVALDMLRPSMHKLYLPQYKVQMSPPMAI